MFNFVSFRRPTEFGFDEKRRLVATLLNMTLNVNQQITKTGQITLASRENRVQRAWSTGLFAHGALHLGEIRKVPSWRKMRSVAENARDLQIWRLLGLTELCGRLMASFVLPAHRLPEA